MFSILVFLFANLNVFNIIILLLMGLLVTYLIFKFIVDGFKLSKIRVLRYFQISLLVYTPMLALIKYYPLFFSLPFLFNYFVIYCDNKDEIEANNATEPTSNQNTLVLGNSANPAIPTVPASASGRVNQTPSNNSDPDLDLHAHIERDVPLLSQTIESGAVHAGEGFLASIIEHLILDDLNDNTVLYLLSGILALNCTNLIIIIILFITFISKLIFSFNYQLNWLQKILPTKYSGTVRDFILRTLRIFEQIRTFNIIMTIIMLFFSAFTATYYFALFYVNLEGMCNLYLEQLNDKK